MLSENFCHIICLYKGQWSINLFCVLVLLQQLETTSTPTVNVTNNQQTSHMIVGNGDAVSMPTAIEESCDTASSSNVTVVCLVYQ
jgi:hypothetical protein